MTSFEKRRLALQIAVGVAAVVPVLIGLWGVLTGFGAPGHFADSHYRYLSGILLGIGVMFYVLIPAIEHQRWPFRMLCALVALGGLARAGAALGGGVGLGGELALVMELIITPLLFLWRERIDAEASRLRAAEGPWG